MSGLLPRETIDYFRRLNDLGVQFYGMECTLFIPVNLTALEPNDVYTAPTQILYKEYEQQLVWLDWYDKKIVKLRKNNLLIEKETPITARFKLEPKVIIGSYISLPTRFMDNHYHTNEFDVVNPLMENMYDSEVFQYFKMYPRRAKTNANQIIN